MIKWVDYGDDECTWEFAENLENAQLVLLDLIINHFDTSAKKSQSRSPWCQKNLLYLRMLNLLLYISHVENSSVGRGVMLISDQEINCLRILVS